MQGECDNFADTLVDTGCNVLTYDYGKIYNQLTRDVILNFSSLRDERKENPSTKTKFLYKLETDAASKILFQWANYLSRECVNSIDEPTIDDDLFESQLPRHEQIYDVQQLNSGRTLSRIVFYLIYCGSHIEPQINLLESTDSEHLTSTSTTITRGRSPSTFSNNSNKSSRKNSLENTNVRKKSTISSPVTPRIKIKSRNSSIVNSNVNQPAHPLTIVNQKKINTLGFNRFLLAQLKEVEDNPKLLLEMTIKFAAEFLSIPIYNFQDILDGKKMEIMAFLGNLFVTGPPTRDEKDLDGIRECLLEYDDLNAHMNDLHGRLIYSTRTIKEIKESLIEYNIPLAQPEIQIIKKIDASKRSSVLSASKIKQNGQNNTQNTQNGAHSARKIGSEKEQPDFLALSNDEFEPSEKSSENSSGKTVGIVANNESDEINEGGIINNIEKSNGENMNNDETNVDGEDIDEVRNFILCYDNI